MLIYSIRSFFLENCFVYSYCLCRHHYCFENYRGHDGDAANQNLRMKTVEHSKIYILEIEFREPWCDNLHLVAEFSLLPWESLYNEQFNVYLIFSVLIRSRTEYYYLHLRDILRFPS